MKSVKVSIIIPVYNAEKYIMQCLDSVVNQTLEDIEIICIDDGSTDNSLSILEEYAIKDDRIIVTATDHKGAGSARNEGLKIAKGDYISFVDSDDWIEINTYEKLYNLAISKDPDMIFFKMCNYNNEDDEFYSTDYYDLECIKEFFTGLTYDYHDFKDQLFCIAVSPCNKLYKRSFLEIINAKFSEGLIFEDNPFFYNNILNAEKILLYDEYLYFRRRRKSSVMSLVNSKHFDIIPITNEIISIFENNDLFEEFKKGLLNKKIFLIRSLVYDQLDEKYKSDFFKYLKEDFSLIKESKDLTKDNLTYMNFNFYSNSEKTDDFKEFDLLNEKSNLELRIVNIKRDFKEKNRLLTEKNKKLLNWNKKLVERNKKLNGRNNNLKEKNKKVHERNKNLKEKNKKVHERNKNLKEKNKQLKDKLNEIYSSNSWKITGPIRKIGKKIR